MADDAQCIAVGAKASFEKTVPTNRIGRRIVVIGSTGSGKSMLAATLAGRFDVPFVELDALFWEPAWMPADEEVFRERVQDATVGDGWVVAGNYGSVAPEIVWPRVKTAVWLDYTLPLILRRLVARSWRRYRSNELLWGTNRERFWRHFYHRDSLLLYAVTSHRRRRRQYEAAMADPRWSHIDFVRLRSPRATERWLAEAVPARG